MLKKSATMAVLALMVLFALEGASAWAAADLEEGVKDLAEKITKSMIEKQKQKIAIVDFSDLNGNVTVLGQFMAEELTTQLFTLAPGKFEVVERRQLLKLEEELILGQIGVLEEKGLKKMGQVLGVEAIVTGSMTDLGNTVKVNARMIAVESAKVFAVAATSIPKTGIVADLASKGVERKQLVATPGAAPAPSAQAARSTPSPAATKAKYYQELPKIRVEIEQLRVGKNQLTVFLNYINKTDEHLAIALVSPYGQSEDSWACWPQIGKTFVLDSDNNRYPFLQGSGLSGGWSTCNYFAQGTSALRIEPKASAKAALTFAVREAKKSTAYDLVSEQTFLSKQKVQWSSEEQEAPSGKFTISIRAIEPQ